MSNSKTTANETALQETIKGLVGHLKDNPEEATTSFTATSELIQGFQVNLSARDFDFRSDEPEDFGGTDQGPSPVEYVLAALGACQDIVVKTHATLLGIDVQSAQTEIEGDLDLQGFLDISDERPGFKNVSFKTEIETDETDSEKLDELKALTVNRCPVLDIIANETPVEGGASVIKSKPAVGTTK